MVSNFLDFIQSLQFALRAHHFLWIAMKTVVGIVLQVLIASVATLPDMMEMEISSSLSPPVDIEVDSSAPPVPVEPGIDSDATIPLFKTLFAGKGLGGKKGGSSAGKGVLRGFLPALPGVGGLGFLGGTKEGRGGEGKGLLGGLGGKGGVLKGPPGVGQDDSKKNPDGGNGWSAPQGDCDGKDFGGEGKSPLGLGGKLKLPFGRGRGSGKLNVFRRFNQDLPCAAGLSTLPIIDKIPGLPKDRFPSFIPSGVNTCDATCGGKDSNVCTYNWKVSLTGFPFLLFRCECKDKCPPKKILFGGYLNIGCENVSNQQSRCKCPNGQQTYKCTINILPLFQKKNAYYCACCNNSNPEGGYNLGGGGYSGGGSGSSSVGGYSFGGGDTTGPKEVPQGTPLGSEHYYSHL